jgi:hypothetical protein
VTEAQLQAAVDKLDGKINTLSNGMKTIETRVAGVASEQGRMGLALRKESADRKKETEGLRRELKQTREMSAILPLLSQPSSIPLLDGQNKQVIDSLSSLLPFLLLSSSGGDGSSSGSNSGGMFGGDNSSMLMIALLLGSK